MITWCKPSSIQSPYKIIYLRMWSIIAEETKIREAQVKGANNHLLSHFLQNWTLRDTWWQVSKFDTKYDHISDNPIHHWEQSDGDRISGTCSSFPGKDPCRRDGWLEVRTAVCTTTSSYQPERLPHDKDTIWCICKYHHITTNLDTTYHCGGA